MLTRAGTLGATLVGALLLAGCITVIRGIPRLEVEVVPRFALVIQNGLAGRLLLRDAGGVAGLELPPGAAARIEFAVRTIAELEPLDGGFLRERVGTRRRQASSASPLLAEFGFDVAVNARAPDGDAWQFVFDPADCGAEAAPERRLVVTGPPQAGIPLPLCAPRR